MWVAGASDRVIPLTGNSNGGLDQGVMRDEVYDQGVYESPQDPESENLPVEKLPWRIVISKRWHSSDGSDNRLHGHQLDEERMPIGMS